MKNELFTLLNGLVIPTDHLKLDHILGLYEESVKAILIELADADQAIDLNHLAKALDLAKFSVTIEFEDASGYHKWHPRYFVLEAMAKTCVDEEVFNFTQKVSPVHRQATAWRITFNDSKTNPLVAQNGSFN